MPVIITLVTSKSQSQVKSQVGKKLFTSQLKIGQKQGGTGGDIRKTMLGRWVPISVHGVH